MNLTNNYLITAIMLVISLFCRIFTVRKCLPGSDVFGHLLFAKTLREQGGGPYSHILLPLVGATPHAQPLLWHWLVGRFSIQAILRNQAWINAAFDAMFVPIIFIIAIHTGNSTLVAISAAVTYLLTPMWFSSIALGPRISGFTPRLSSELITNIFFAICLLPLGLSGAGSLVIAGVLAWLVISSSKFGLQALLFLSPIVSLISSNYMPMYAFMVGILLSLVFSRGEAFKIFKSQLAHLQSYFRENLKRRMHISDRNSFAFLLTKRLHESRIQYFVHIIHRLLRENSYTSLILKMPVLFLVLFGIVQDQTVNAAGGSTSYVSPILAGTILFLVINLRPLLFLGEAERYLNHIAIFIVLFAAQYAVTSSSVWLLIGIWVYGFAFWILEIAMNHSFKTKILLKRMIEDNNIIADLKSMRPTVVLAYPYQNVGGTFRIGLETQHLSIYTLEGAFTELTFTQDFNQRYSEGYPFVKLSALDEMSERFGIGYVVVDRNSLRIRGIADWKPSANWTRRGVGGEVYDVYTLNDLNSTTEQIVEHNSITTLPSTNSLKHSSLDDAPVG